MSFSAKRIILLVFTVFLNGLTNAQSGAGNYLSGFEQQGNTFSFTCDQARVRLEWCTESMFRLRYVWTGDFAADEPWMVSRYEWPQVRVISREEPDKFVIQTGSLQVTVSKMPFAIAVTAADGKVLSEENPELNGGPWTGEGAVGCRKTLFADEHFFGFGERMDFLDRRGKKVDLNVGRGTARPHILGAYNVLEANYCPVPFFMSTRGYGIFFHNSFATSWDMGSSDPAGYTFKATGGELDYYFIYGPGFPAMLNQYTGVTGKAPLMPRFALGLQVGTYSGGTWGYEANTSTDYVVNLVKKFRELGIPLDILHLDSTWRIFGENGGKGATSFEWRETFKNPKAMFDSLYALHINLAGVHIRPRFDNGKKLRLLDQARKQGFVYPEDNNPGEFVNFFDPEAVDWWWKNGVMNVASIGAKFLKTDEGSAFGAVANESDKVGPTGKTIEQLHNVFPIAYAKAPYEHFQQFNGIRGMNHTREGYAGIQRYPFIFAGDWPSEWQYFAPVIKAGLNIGISGVGNWAHCMGGFEHPADPELYIRWCQFGLLSPVAHLFGMDHPGYKEPWNYGEDGLRIFREYDRMRYRLIPYLYSHSYQMYLTGMPVMRALVLEYQDDPNVYDIMDQYLLGESMMVCPVTVKGAQTRVIYLPKGTWVDYWTGRSYAGKQYIQVETPLDRIPILVKAGAIIPMQEAMDYVGQKPVDRITFDLFPGGSSEFTVYDDDGKSLDYQSGKFAATVIHSEQTEDRLDVQIDKPNGAYQLPKRTYRLKIHTPSAPQSVAAGMKPLAMSTATDQPGWHYDGDSKILWVNPGGNSEMDIFVNIRFK